MSKVTAKKAAKESVKKAAKGAAKKPAEDIIARICLKPEVKDKIGKPTQLHLLRFVNKSKKEAKNLILANITTRKECKKEKNFWVSKPKNIKKATRYLNYPKDILNLKSELFKMANAKKMEAVAPEVCPKNPNNEQKKICRSAMTYISQNDIYKVKNKVQIDNKGKKQIIEKGMISYLNSLVHEFKGNTTETKNEFQNYLNNISYPKGIKITLSDAQKIYERFRKIKKKDPNRIISIKEIRQTK